MAANSGISSDSTIKFQRDYYSSRDYSHWAKKIRADANKLAELKTGRARSGYLLELYSSYLQFCEIFLTNTRIATTRELEILKTLFITNDELRKFYKEAGLRDDFYQWFLKNIDFAINEKDAIKEYQRKHDEHWEILREVIEDYLADYDYLNAYKHGFRVKATSPKPNDGIIDYINREKRQDGSKKFDIYENTIDFKVTRVVIKTMFMMGMLDNLRVILAHEPGTKIKIYYYSFLDRSPWEQNAVTKRSKDRLSL